jgi:hypothetical protein
MMAGSATTPVYLAIKAVACARGLHGLSKALILLMDVSNEAGTPRPMGVKDQWAGQSVLGGLATSEHLGESVCPA